MTYNFNLDCSTEHYEIKIDTEAKHGYFERNRDGEGGELLFKFNPNMDKHQLVDYDGVFELPGEVAEALVSAGIIVGHEY